MTVERSRWLVMLTCCVTLANTTGFLMARQLIGALVDDPAAAETFTSLLWRLYVVHAIVAAAVIVFALTAKKHDGEPPQA
jgi:anti-sigma-K factor RskA